MAEVTIFVEDSAIKLLVSKGRRVTNWAKLPLEPGLVSNGVILDEDLIASKLKESFKRLKLGARKVIVGLSGVNSICRVISFPELPEAIIPEAIKREAERVIPVPLEQVYLSYQLIPASKGELRAFLAAFPRSTADVLLRTLHKAGIKPYLMDLASLALCRTIDEPKAIIIAARVGYLDILVMVDRVPQVIRGLSLPSEAESLSENLDTITEEVDRTVSFYNSSHEEQPLDSATPVSICGDLLEASDAWQSLAGRLNRPVSLLTPPVQYPEGFPVNEFVVNIGLALKNRSLEKKQANISLLNFNALPEAYLPKAPRLSTIFVPIGIAAGIGLIIYMGLFVQSAVADTAVLRSKVGAVEPIITQQFKEIAALKEQIQELEPQIKPVESQIEQVRTTTDAFKTTFDGLENGRVGINADLSDIVTLLPESIDLTRIDHSDSRVTVAGIAPSEDDILSYARSLRLSARFPVVNVSLLKAIENEEEEAIEGFDFEVLLMNKTGK